MIIFSSLHFSFFLSYLLKYFDPLLKKILDTPLYLYKEEEGEIRGNDKEKMMRIRRKNRKWYWWSTYLTSIIALTTSFICPAHCTAWHASCSCLNPGRPNNTKKLVPCKDEKEIVWVTSITLTKKKASLLRELNRNDTAQTTVYIKIDCTFISALFYVYLFHPADGLRIFVKSPLLIERRRGHFQAI